MVLRCYLPPKAVCSSLIAYLNKGQTDLLEEQVRNASPS